MLLELQNISKYYENPGTGIRQIVLSDISLQVKKGDSMAIVGPSGSGKSTLLNIMGSLDRPVSGKLLFNGTDVESLDDASLAEFRNRNIGFVFQLHHLLPQLNALENILLPTLTMNNKTYRKAAVERAKELLSFVNLKDKINQYPGNMSVGECQRIAVVRALINQPEIILADEPTGSLDKASAENLGEMLNKLNRDFQVAMVVVTHSQLLAESMALRYSLSEGKLDTA